VLVEAGKALAACTKIDECADWAQKSAAMASYHKQMNDRTLLDMAQRIRLRAIARAGELLNQLEREKGGRSKKCFPWENSFRPVHQAEKSNRRGRYHAEGSR
jgi:hypothetical protein